MGSWAALKEKHKRTQVSVVIPMAADLADEHDLLAAQLRRARDEDEQEARDPQAPLIAQRMLDLEAEIRASEVTFTFQAISRSAYRQLLAKHKPTETQQAEAERQGVTDPLDYNLDTFPPALFAACAVRVVDAAGDETPVSDIDWAELWTEWSNGQTTRLWRTCLLVNAAVADTPKSVAASAVMAGSATS